MWGSSGSPKKKAKTELGEATRIGRFTVETIRTMKILIAEGDESTRDELRSLVNSAEVDVIVRTVSNGIEAVNLYQAGESFNGIFINLELPVLNGILVARTLRARGVSSKIIGMVPGRVSDNDLVSEFENMVNECYRLPISAEDMRSVLHRVSLYE